MERDKIKSGLVESTYEKLKCPNCNDELYRIKNKLVCGNEKCDFQCIKDELIQNIEKWNIRISDDDEFWYKDVYVDFPYIVASEYKRLNDLLVDNKLYGMIFQMKDVFEIILKLPTLLSINSFISNKSRSKEENEVIKIFVSKMLSLGDWHSIARKCIYLSDDSDLKKILTDVVKIYDKQKITKWRNDTIGHGALMFDSTDEFKNDLTEKLRILKAHFVKCEQQYINMKMTYKTKKQNVELIGANVSRHLLSTKGKLLWGQKNQINDLILVHEKELFFFDSFLSRNRKTKLLSYINASIIKLRLKCIEETYKNVPKELHAESDSFSRIDEGIYVESEADMINLISMNDKTINPIYLKEWLSDRLESNKKGVYLLQMEEGMGKTIFSKLLDPHVSGKIKLEGVFVRSYYINSSYSYKLDIFQNDIIDTLKNNNDMTDRLKGDIPRFNDNSSQSLSEQFANILNGYQQAYSGKFNNDKLLIVIDGLDEIPNLNMVSIFDYIPKVEDLSDNVHVLLTSRLECENIAILNNKIQSINFTDTIAIDRENEDYIMLLRNHIHKNMKVSSNELISSVIEYSDSRFSYIKPIECIMRYREKNDITETSIFEEFLQILKENYTDKYYNQIIRLVSILAISRNGLDINEISFLTFGEKPNFKLLAYIADISCLLSTKRTTNGSIISLSHYSLRKYIIQNFNDEIRRIIKMWINELKTINLATASKEEKFIVFNILYFTKEYIPEKVQAIINDENMNIRLVYDVFASSDSTSNDIKMLLLFMDDLIEILESNPKIHTRNLIISYILRMQVYVNYGFGRVSQSNNYIDRALEIMEKYKIKNNILKMEALKIRSEYYRKIGNIKKSIEDNNLIGQMLAKLSNNAQKKLEMSSLETAYMLLSKSINQKNLGQLEDSIKNNLYARDLVSNDDSFEGRMLYSNSLNSLGLCYIRSNNYDKAEENIRESIVICEALMEDYGIFYNEIFNLYANLCQVFRRKNRHKEAIELYSKSIYLITEKENLDDVFDLNLKALQYNNRGNIYLDLGHKENRDVNFQCAIEDYLEGIQIIESLDSTNQNIRLLQNLYLNIYNMYKFWVIHNEKAEEYMIKINEVGRRLLRIQLDLVEEDDKYIDDINYDLQSRQLMKSAEKDMVGEELDKAAKKFSEAIILLEKINLNEENKNDIEHMLCCAYFNRAYCYNTLLNHKITYYFNKAREGKEVSYDYSMFEPRNIIRDYIIAISFSVLKDSEIVEIYERISNIFCEVLKEYDEAKKYAFNALQIDSSRLFGHIYLGNAYYEVEDYEKSIECYNRAISINPNYQPVQQCLISAKLALAKKKNLKITIV